MIDDLIVMEVKLLIGENKKKKNKKRSKKTYPNSIGDEGERSEARKRE